MSTGPGDAPEVNATNPTEMGHPARVEGGRASSDLPEPGRPGARPGPRPEEGGALPAQPEAAAVPSSPTGEDGFPRDEAWSWKPWYVPAALAAGLALLFPLVRLRFLGDDFIWVYEAAHQSLPGLFQRGYFEFVRPFNELYWLLMWTVSGTDPRGYHLVTMGLYALTALLFYRWIRELTESPWAGFASLCLFLANPVHAEPVGWPSACSEALAGAFVLAALYAYRRWRLGGESLWMGATLATLALAFGSKESSIAVLPGLLLVELTLVPPGEKPWKRIQALLTMFVPSAVVLLALALSVSPEAGYKTAITGRTFTVWMDLINRAFLAGEGRDALLRALPQSADLVVCVALAAALVLTWKRAPAVFLHLAWLPCTLVAYAVFVPDLTVSDRYFYLASMASAGAAGCLLARLRGNQAVVWGVLLAMVVAMGSLQTVRQARWMAENFSLPQPEAQTLPAALARHRAGAPLFVYCPPRAELHPLYACAVLGGLDLQQIRPWPDILREAALPEGSVAIFWDEFSNRFTDCTEAARRGLRDMVSDGRAPRTREKNLQKDSSPLATFPGGQGWTGQGMTAAADGTWTTPGLGGRLSGPKALLSPFAVQAVHVELEVRQAAPGATCGLLWYSEANPEGQTSMEVATPLPTVPGKITAWLFPGDRPGWWTQGRITQLELVLSTAPAEIRVNSITVYGYPRQEKETPPSGGSGVAAPRG